MAITQKFIPGPRLIDGSDLNTLVDEANAALQGDITPSSVTTSTVTTVALTASGAVKLTGLPTADPGVAGELWSNSDVVTVSAG